MAAKATAQLAKEPAAGAEWMAVGVEETAGEVERQAGEVAKEATTVACVARMVVAKVVAKVSRQSRVSTSRWEHVRKALLAALHTGRMNSKPS